MAVPTLAEVKRHLSIKASDYDDILPAVITAAIAYVGMECGPLESTSVTTRVPGGGDLLVLPVRPLLSVTSVTGKSGAVVPASTYTVWTDYASVSAVAGGCFSEDYYDVVYAAGRTTCPGPLAEAVKWTVSDMWSPVRGPAAGVAGSEPISARARAEFYMAPYRLGVVG